MGYFIALEQNYTGLIRKLKLDPSELLEKRYSGYIWVLIEKSDLEIFKWLQDNVLALDSLTGNDAAYCIFSNRAFPIKYSANVMTDEINPEERIRAGLLRRIRSQNQSIVRDVELINKNEALAITYGTDIIAKRLNIIDQLPCLVVFDGLTRKDFLVIPLRNAKTSDLMDLFRKSIQGFIKHPRYQDYKKGLLELNICQKELSEHKKKMETPIEHVFKKKLEIAVQLIESIRKVIALHKSIKTITSTANYRNKNWIPIIKEDEMDHALAEIQETNARLGYLKDRIYRLSYLLDTFSWPLNESNYEKYSSLCTKLVFPLLDVIPEDWESRAGCQYLIATLKEIQSDIIKRIMSDLPTSDELENRYKLLMRDNVKERQDENMREYERIQQRIHHILEFLYNDDKPSLIKSFSNISTELGFLDKPEKILDSIANYAKSWLKPEVLVQIPQWFKP